jgi:Tol biopolymer transport system component
MRFRAIPASAKWRGVLSLAVAAVIAASLMVLVAATRPAEAAFPGNNGVIAFSSSRITPENPEGDLEIFLYVPGSGTLSQLTSNNEIDAEPTWSADGTKIAFTSSRDSSPAGFNFEVYTMNADGSNQIRLTNSSSTDEHPAWSPDGTKIVFESQRNNGNPEVYKMNADGSDQTRLTYNSAYDTQPAWSPNGKKLAFVSSRKGNGYPEVYKMKPRPEGRNNRPVRLTNNAAYDYSPDWSPDGTKLAFWTNRDGNFEVYTMNSDGTVPIKLTNNVARDIHPYWQPS